MIQNPLDSRRANSKAAISMVRDSRNREYPTARSSDSAGKAAEWTWADSKGITMTDTEVMRHCAAGDTGAFEVIINRYKDSVYTFLRRFLNRQDMVDDVFQDTFLQVYASRNTFDPSRPLRPWLFTIAANKAKDALRRTRQSNSTTFGSMCDDDCSIDDVLGVLEQDEHVPCDDLIRDERAAAVEQGIARMPARLREILILAYYQKCTYAEMAEILGIRLGTVKSRLHTAVGRFAKEMETTSLV
jgi:RNA polymerase sigma-70 factor, ECF subfamily